MSIFISRVPEPPRREGQCPSEIEILLRDYSRAREEARTEIARARDRLRERTEQEKRRLQQQTLSQMVRVRTSSYCGLVSFTQSSAHVLLQLLLDLETSLVCNQFSITGINV